MFESDTHLSFIHNLNRECALCVQELRKLTHLPTYILMNFLPIYYTSEI